MYKNDKKYTAIKAFRRTVLVVLTVSIIGGVTCLAYSEVKYKSLSNVVYDGKADSIINANASVPPDEDKEVENIGVADENDIDGLIMDSSTLEEESNNITGASNDKTTEKIDDKEEPRATTGTDEETERKQGQGYFDKSLFIGNSIVEGFSRWGDLNNATFYSMEGMNVNSFFNTNRFTLNNKKTTPDKALSKGHYNKVFLMFGINELGWRSKEAFINRYIDVIEAVRKKQPEAKIYIQSMLYVTKKKNNNDKLFTNKNIEKLNKRIKKMSEKNGAEYIDLNETICNGKKYLPAEASTDGIHLTPKYCKKWKESLFNYFDIKK